MRRLIALVVLVVAALALWVWREPLLTSIGRLVIEEAEPAPADLVVLLSNNSILAASKTAALGNRGFAPRVLLFAARPGPVARARRTGKLLRRALGERSVVLMRAFPARDSYRPERWWRNSDDAQQRLTAALRWLNSFVLGDLRRDADERRSRATTPAAWFSSGG